MYSVIPLTLNMSLTSSSFQLASVKGEVKNFLFLILGVLHLILGVCGYPQKRIYLLYLLITTEVINTPAIVSCVKILIGLFRFLGLTLG